MFTFCYNKNQQMNNVKRLPTSETDSIDCFIGRVSPELDASSLNDMTLVPLWEEGMAIGCAIDNPRIKNRKIGLPELSTFDWATASRRAHTRQIFDDFFLAAGLHPPTPHIESMSFHTNLCLVARSQLLTFARESAIQHYAMLGPGKASET